MVFVRPIHCFFLLFICFCSLLIFSNGQGENEFSHFLEEEKLGTEEETSAQANSKAISKSMEGNTNNVRVSLFLISIKNQSKK